METWQIIITALVVFCVVILLIMTFIVALVSMKRGIYCSNNIIILFDNPIMLLNAFCIHSLQGSPFSNG